ncbi:SPOR domain-containing protein [Actibacterium sp. MT2.3-13A]|uniref:SPOR domain-containing protein n=1 Tax=Actibacterium sp. MT2.3-13A TaxID=2828332 RepID=UPI001BA5FB75|nr:SPOR domain-containing protein [Actibacterium sp. MT2.3-13A]
MAEIEFGEFEAEPQPRRGGFQSIVNWAGALTSVALVLGLAFWGYRLTVRDVTGVPVVRALEGPMRVAPEDPGGEAAAHQGLAVNAVAAAGEAEPPAERLVLAPRPVALTAEDTPAASTPRLAPAAPAAEAAPKSAAEDDAPLVSPDPIQAALAIAVAESGAAGTAAAAGPETVPASLPGIARSPRPARRPEAALATRAAQPPATITPADIEIAAADVSPGTNLVQLGAYDSADVARAEWQRLSGRFDALMAGKQRLVQSAKSGGRTFYRLRAVGFADISDARRFCAALTAEKAGCIPVVAR